MSPAIFTALLAAFASAVNDLQRATDDYVNDPSELSESIVGASTVNAAFAFQRVSEARALISAPALPAPAFPALPE